MSEQNKYQTGDGQDNFGNAAKQSAKAAKQIGKNAVKGAAKKGAEATVNAATATVKAGAQAGKAVANVAAGTAAGGPWGAIISAAWSMRHTLFKLLVSTCLVIVFLVVTIVSLPAIIFDGIFGLPEDYSGNSLTTAYSELSTSVHQTVIKGHDYALDKVNSIVKDGGYDYKRSMDALTDCSVKTADYDVCYALSVYSASMGQTGVSAENMVSKMTNAFDEMFVVTYEILYVEIPIISDLLEIIGTEIISYVKCIIQPITNAFFLAAFGVDVNAKYGEFDITFGEAIDFMTQSLKTTLEGANQEYSTEGT